MKARKRALTARVLLFVGLTACVLAAAIYKLMTMFPKSSPLISSNPLDALPLSVFHGEFGPYLAIGLIALFFVLLSVCFFIAASVARKKARALYPVHRLDLDEVADRFRCFNLRTVGKSARRKRKELTYGPTSGRSRKDILTSAALTLIPMLIVGVAAGVRYGRFCATRRRVWLYEYFSRW